MPYYHSPILYIIHCKKWKDSQYLRLYISELNSKMVCFIFGKNILNIRSLSYNNLKRVHLKFSTCRSTLRQNTYIHTISFILNNYEMRMSILHAYLSVLQLPVYIDLSFCNVTRQIRNRMSDI